MHEKSPTITGRIMAEPFKNMLNKNVITNIAKHLSKAWPAFDSKGFIVMATDDLDSLELKQRSMRITESLNHYFPDDFQDTANIILKSLAPEEGYEINVNKSDQGIIGWAIMPLVDYVGIYGLEHFDLSMTLFKELTKRSSSEFGIRYFLNQDQQRTLVTLETWLNDPNQHVRRLISEGTRPRLPWGMRLQNFVKDPAPILALLDRLKDDSEEYVRRSVANNLNDIAKDHPELVANIAESWLKDADKNRQKLVRHACRTLIKQGHQQTLQALGYKTPKITMSSLSILTPRVKFGSALQFAITVTSESQKSQQLMIDYAIHHCKANGKTSAKIFKWKDINLDSSKTIHANKNHAIKKITTRTYYAGTHQLEIFINGISFGIKNFELIM